MKVEELLKTAREEERLGNYKRALKLYRQSKKRGLKEGNDEVAKYAIQSIGANYYYLHKYSRARGWFKAILRGENDKEGRLSLFQCIALTCHYQGKRENSYRWIKGYLAKAYRQHSLNHIEMGNYYFGDFLQENGEYGVAKKFLSRAIGYMVRNKSRYVLLGYFTLLCAKLADGDCVEAIYGECQIAMEKSVLFETQCHIESLYFVLACCLVLLEGKAIEIYTDPVNHLSTSDQFFSKGIAIAEKNCNFDKLIILCDNYYRYLKGRNEMERADEILTLFNFYKKKINYREKCSKKYRFL